jgi:hypothetical protein
MDQTPRPCFEKIMSLYFSIKRSLVYVLGGKEEGKFSTSLETFLNKCLRYVDKHALHRYEKNIV